MLLISSHIMWPHFIWIRCVMIGRVTRTGSFTVKRPSSPWLRPIIPQSRRVIWTLLLQTYWTATCLCHVTRVVNAFTVGFHVGCVRATAFWFVAATATWVASQPLGSDEMRSVEMRFNVWYEHTLSRFRLDTVNNAASKGTWITPFVAPVRSILSAGLYVTAFHCIFVRVLLHV